MPSGTPLAACGPEGMSGLRSADPLPERRPPTPGGGPSAAFLGTGFFMMGLGVTIVMPLRPEGGAAAGAAGFEATAGFGSGALATEFGFGAGLGAGFVPTFVVFFAGFAPPPFGEGFASGLRVGVFLAANRFPATALPGETPQCATGRLGVRRGPNS